MSIDPLRFVRRRLSAMQPLALSLALICASAVHAQTGDKNAEKAARRAQLQMQNLQQQIQEAQAAKAKVESDKAALDKQLGDQSKQLSQLKSALPRATQSLKAAEAERARLAESVAALEKQLAEQKTAAAAEAAAAATAATAATAAMVAKDRELAQLTKARDEQLALAQRRFDEQVVNVGECTTKNDRLIRLNAELLDRYRNKTTVEILKQREPALGFGDVQMFNLIQDYRDKAEAERYSPPTNR